MIIDEEEKWDGYERGERTRLFMIFIYFTQAVGYWRELGVLRVACLPFGKCKT